MTDTIRIIHTERPGYGWGFESPDVPGLIGGSDSYEQAHEESEAAVRFHYEDDPSVDVACRQFVHYVPEHSVTTR